MDTYNKIILSEKYSKEFESEKWTYEVPKISFPSDWQISITPPMVGAVVRFRVYKDNAEVSVYLDCYDVLGIVGEPYWEIYPIEESTQRFLMNDIDGLLDGISNALESQINHY